MYRMDFGNVTLLNSSKGHVVIINNFLVFINTVLDSPDSS